MSRPAAVTEKKVFNPYVDLEAPRRRIDELCRKYPDIGEAVNEWKEARMADPKLQAEYENLEDFVDFNLSQFLRLTAETKIKKNAESEVETIFTRSTLAPMDKELHVTFQSIVDVVWTAPETDLHLLVVNGLWYSEGSEDDRKKAASIFQIAADKGYAPAQLALASCCANGAGTKKNLEEAAVLFKLAADQEFAIAAQHYLSFCHKNGVNIVKDQKAVRLCELALEKGLTLDQMKFAVDQGLAPVQNALALNYQNGVGVKKDLVEAVRLYGLAVAQNYAPAQNNLAICYRNGVGVEKNLEKARKLFELAVVAGGVESQYNLAHLYADGIGGEKKLEEAARLFELAAKQGLAGAQCNLAACYEKGLGVEKNSGRAALLYSKLLTQDFLDQKGRVKKVDDRSSLIAKLAEDGKDDLSAVELFDIHQNLVARLHLARVEPMESKSLQMIQACIAEKIKAETGLEMKGEWCRGETIIFKRATEKAERSGRVTVLNPLLAKEAQRSDLSFDEDGNLTVTREKLMRLSSSDIGDVEERGKASGGAGVRDAPSHSVVVESESGKSLAGRKGRVEWLGTRH